MTKEEAYNVLLQAWQGNKDAENHPSFDDINEALYTIKQALERLNKLEKINEELKDYDILLFAKIFNYSRVIKEYLSYYPQLDKFEWNEKNNHYELTTNDGNYWVIDKKHYDLLMKLKEVLGNE